MSNESGAVRKGEGPFLLRAQRFGDVVLASLLLAITAPVLCFAAFAILLDSPGPVFVRQQRIGVGGRRVSVLCFRTRPSHRINRMTRVGWLLHWSRIEELPQLINVMRGELTLFGTGLKRS
jgi:lipopolysaccharide/colanic/teichoic acid biosynthesis glycosyltransferase